MTAPMPDFSLSGFQLSIIIWQIFEIIHFSFPFFPRVVSHVIFLFSIPCLCSCFYLISRHPSFSSPSIMFREWFSCKNCFPPQQVEVKAVLLDNAGIHYRAKYKSVQLSHLSVKTGPEATITKAAPLSQTFSTADCFSFLHLCFFCLSLSCAFSLALQRAFLCNTCTYFSRCCSQDWSYDSSSSRGRPTRVSLQILEKEPGPGCTSWSQLLGLEIGVMWCPLPPLLGWRSGLWERSMGVSLK